ncbi:unnamed protein product [Adineta ricciae]|uniref:Uncharacterized protein n=1 Tax=Adineta ricciae TaxID=249248 RepID=A0A815RUF1_ADIRI|nr:unnamed protein product [Adineta ricciae]
MEIDSRCLFADLDGCSETSTPCYGLCKPPVNADDISHLHDCKTKIENLLFQYGRFDMAPCNVEEYHYLKPTLINRNMDRNLHLIQTGFADAYNNASHWTVRGEILSILAKDVTLPTLLHYIPGLTEHRFYMARQHST